MIGWLLPMCTSTANLHGREAIQMATLGVYRKLSPTLLPLFPPPGVTAQVHWVLAGTLLSGKCAAEYLVQLHPLLVQSPGVKRICV